MLGSWCLAGVLGLAGVLVSCWGLFVLLGSWCGPGGLATITPPTTFVIDFRAVISMYLGGVISGPKDGVISDRNLRTRRQNEFYLLPCCCGGASRSDSNPPQQPPSGGAPTAFQSMFPTACSGPPQENVALATLLQERRSTSSPRWGPRPPSDPLALRGVFHQKGTFTSTRGGCSSLPPPWFFAKT